MTSDELLYELQIKDLQDTVEHLRQRPVFCAVQTEHDALRAEIERLTDDNRRLAECWTTEQESHQQTHAEIVRLRADLEELRRAHDAHMNGDPCPICGEAQPEIERLRAALESLIRASSSRRG